MADRIEHIYNVPDKTNLMMLYGRQDDNLKILEERMDLRLIARGHNIKIIGYEQDVSRAETVLDELIQVYDKRKSLSKTDVLTAIQISGLNHKTDGTQSIFRSENDEIVVAALDGFIKPKTDGQKNLVQALTKNDIIFAVGPAGTGKTYLAVAMAVAYLKEQRVKKIILARPAVEAGESLGFLPGDFKEKIDPYLKPLYDALEDMLPRDVLRKYLEQEVIEIIPLAFMRGRTLNNAFVILDEAQNSTFMQMKMFLTRLGHNAKAVITGDITQIDLPKIQDSGLISSVRILANINGIAIVKMSKEDVVRHQLVRDIIKAYDEYSPKTDAKD